MSAASLNAGYISAVTAELRANGWQPDDRYLCGCNRFTLCEHHRTERAVEHYHPRERVCQLPACGCDGTWHA
jgi:hypothetical protein